MTDDSDLSQLQNAYHIWHETKGSSGKPWLDLMDDEVCIYSMGEEAPGLSFAKDRQSKEEVVEYLTGLLVDWTMVHWTPEIFVSEGDRIAMFGHTAWTNKATGKTAETRIAHLWKFRDGKIVEFTEVFDSARVAGRVHRLIRRRQNDNYPPRPIGSADFNLQCPWLAYGGEAAECQGM